MKTEHQEMLEQTMPRVVRTSSIANRLAQLLPQGAKPPGTDDPVLLDLAAKPMVDADWMLRYAYLFSAFAETPTFAWADDVAMPTLVVTGLNDRIAHPAHSQALAASLRDAEFLVEDEAAHYPIWDGERAVQLLEHFWARRLGGQEDTA